MKFVLGLEATVSVSVNAVVPLTTEVKAPEPCFLYTLYPVMADPPSDVGAVQFNVTSYGAVSGEFIAVVRVAGMPGTVGVAIDVAAD